MTKVANINCKQYDGYGFCKIKPKIILCLMKQECVELRRIRCDIAERHQRPILKRKTKQ